MIKKILSLFCAVSIIFGILPVIGYSADSLLFEVSSAVIGKGQTKEFKFSEGYFENITIEADYDLTNVSWDDYCNIPFIVICGGQEIGRVSLFSKDEKLLNTRIPNGASFLDTGVVERKGTVRIDVDYAGKKLVYKWIGNGIKKETVLGCSSFLSDSSISALKIGAGYNPGIRVNIRVFKAEKTSIKTQYLFDSEYGGALNGFSEFSRGTSGVVMTKDPLDDTNGVLKIPAGEKLDMVFMPINFGFSGNVRLKHRVYAAAKAAVNLPIEQFYQYITGSTATIAKMDYTSLNGLRVTGSGDSRVTAENDGYLNCWVDIEYLFDFKNDTLLTRVNGKNINLGKDGSKQGEFLKISDFNLINRMYVYNEECDIYVDDICISEVDEPLIYSDTLTVNEETMKISGLAPNAMTDALLNKISVVNGSVGIFSSDGKEKTGTLCKGDYLLLRDYDNAIEKKYLIMGYSEDILQGEKRKKEPSYHIEGQNIASGQNAVLNTGKIYNEDITVEIDYNLSDAKWSGECNIPMILLDGNNNEIGRISVYSQDSEILSTRMNNQKSIINTGGIGRIGTIKIETDSVNKRLIFKYSGTGYKKSATIGYIPFREENTETFGNIQIGASKNPGITVDMRVYESTDAIMKTEFGFDSQYTGSLSKYYDFNSSDGEVVIAKDPQNSYNGCVFIPAQKLWRMSFMPRDCGFSDEVKIKYNMYLSGNDVSNSSIALLQEYITGSTKDIISMRAENETDLKILSGKNTCSIKLSESIMNRWVEVECYLCLNEDKAKVTIDKKTAFTDDGNEYFPIEHCSLFNQIQTRNINCDMYIDNLEIMNGSEVKVSSDIYYADNVNKKITGVDITCTARQLTENVVCENAYDMCVVNSDSEEKTGVLEIGDMLKITDKTGGNSVFYAIEYRNKRIDFENSSDVSFIGGKIFPAPCEKGGYALKSLSDDSDKRMTVSLPQDTEYDTVEFKLYLENNTASASLTVNNANDAQFSKMYLLNQEIMAFLVDGNSLLHSLTTSDRAWQRYKAVIDKEKKLVTWYMNGRKLNEEPIGFANLYDGENTLSSVSVSVSAGSYAYIDDIVVSKFKPLSVKAESTAYTVDNEYQMITGIDENTTVKDFIKSVSPRGYVISKDGNIKSDSEIIKIGDGICFEGNTATSEYAIGLNDASKKEIVSDFKTKIYVSSDGSDSASGSADAPFKTLEKAFETAEIIDGNVNIEILGETFNNSRIKNINKKNGSIMLTSRAVLTGGNVINTFRKLNSEEKAVFTEASEKILCADISGCNIGKTTQSGWNLPFVPSSAELVVNGETQTAARYPNEGYISSGDIVSSSATELTFKYRDNRSELWKKSDNARIWSHFDVAYGGYDIGIDNINSEAKTVTAKGVMYSQNITKPFEYYYYNVPEELDAPGEYYIDEKAELLYYYPKSDNINAVLTDGKEAVIRFENCSNILLDGIKLVGGIGNGIEICGCENVVVNNCEISGSGMNGIVITDGADCGVTHSFIHHTGGDAVKLYGGDPYTLSKAGHYVSNCDIHDFSLRKKSYTSAVTTSGCGMEIYENKIYNAPHTALFLRSCDTQIYKNRFMNTTYDAKDMGCIYSVDTYTRRGISIHDNYFEKIRNKYSEDTGLVKCVYLDNFTSGWEIYNNVFYDCDQGIHANGGRENSIRSNLFISVDSAMGMYNLLDAAFTKAPLYQSNFAPVGSTLWKKAYPGIDEITTTYSSYPYNTEVFGNVIVGSKINKIDFDAYMNISDSVVVSSSKLNGELICDYDICDKNIKEITKNIQSDAILIDGLIPFCGEMRMKKGERKNVSVRVDGKIKIPDLVESSNETKIQTDGAEISAVNPGTATVAIKSGAFERVIKIVCE